MASLVVDILFATERRLVRRLGRVVLSIAVPVVFLTGAVVWGSVAAYLGLSRVTTPPIAALILFGISLGLAGLGFLVLRLRRAAHHHDDTLERMVADLVGRDTGTGTHRAEIAALMVLILDAYLGRRRG